jgi:hypothetical protein
MDKLQGNIKSWLTAQAAVIVSKNMAGVDDVGLELMRMAAYHQAKQNALAHSWDRRTTYAPNCTRRDGKMFLESFDQIGPRWVKDASDITPRLADGWYTDSDCDAQLIGVVVCMTRHGEGEDNYNTHKAKGRVIYMAGTRHTDWDGVTLDLDTTDDPDTAVRWADRMAEREAESCREADEEYQAEQKKIDLLRAIKRARQACLKLLRDMRPIRKGILHVPESVYAVLRNRIEEYLDSIRNYRNELGELA